MSVSMLDKSVSASTSPHRPPTSKATAQPPAPSLSAQHATGISFAFASDKIGPAFDEPQSPANRLVDGLHASRDSRETAVARDAQPQSFMAMLKQWLEQLFGGQRPSKPACGNGAPPRPDPSTGAPSRPFPGIGRPHPKPDYSLQSNEQLTQALLDNFNAFTGNNQSSVMTLRDIREMANKSPGNDPVMNNAIRLAKEILSRPDLMQALDRDGQTGAQDKRISKQDLQSALLDTNFFKFKSDKEVAEEMLSHLDELAERRGGEISVDDLKKLAAQPLTGDSAKDHLIQLAQAVLKRSNVLGALDNNNDGRISRRELERFIR